MLPRTEAAGIPAEAVPGAAQACRVMKHGACGPAGSETRSPVRWLSALVLVSADEDSEAEQRQPSRRPALATALRAPTPI